MRPAPRRSIDSDITFDRLLIHLFNQQRHIDQELVAALDVRNSSLPTTTANIILAYKDDFYNDTTASTEYLIEQMTFAFIKGCSNDDMAVKLCDLLRNSQNSDTDDQLETIAKFLIYFGYSDFANRSDCHLERFLERMDDENGKPQDNN